MFYFHFYARDLVSYSA